MFAQRGWGQKSGKDYEKTNIIAELVNNKAIAPIKLKPGQFVVIHTSKKTQALEFVGCRIMFLPPYFPDLEKFWATMKRWIKQHIGTYQELYSMIWVFFVVP